MAKCNQDVAIMAVVKDEAAYIHEWIHHHLYFGASHIFIGINRTTDNTLKVIQKIQEHHKSVYVYDVNWIDWAKDTDSTINESIQFIAYAYMLDIIRRDFTDIPYCFPLDIDEFWFPKNFEGSLTNWLEKAPYFDTASFYWACQFGDKETFSKPFANLNARLRGQIKSIINLKSKLTLDRVRAHSPQFKEQDKVIHIDDMGNAFLPKQGLKAVSRPTHTPDACILHRMTRSETEYISNLRKGMLEEDTPIKTNRDGYWNTSADYQLNLRTDAINRYHSSLDNFSAKCGLEAEIEIARLEIAEGANLIFSARREQLIRNCHHYSHALQGTKSYENLLTLLSNLKPFTENEINHLEASYRQLSNAGKPYASNILSLLPKS